ncbi:MAG TPA: radical SAM protein [Methylomirabilota bacterium]|nr:radical SAM protein [Methylomirabilota bacterium]
MSRAEQLLQKIPQYTRNARHLQSVLQHGAPRKWANLIRVELERKFRRVELKGHPYLLIIDPCNYCNLRCPLCPTGVHQLGRPQAMLSFAHFQKYFDPFAPYIFEVYLHNWGESLLNKAVYEMIHYAQTQNVGTNLSSNFVDIDSNDIDNLLNCGLEYLVISLDGTSQETYGQYRIRGNYERVVANMSELLRRRQSRKQKTPVIEWQFVVMKHNEHQISEAEMMAKKLGVDLLRFIPVGIPYEFKNRKELADKWFPTTLKGRGESSHEEQQFGQVSKPGPCFYLYRSMVVNPDGGVAPCCVVYQKNRDFADLNASAIDPMQIWNNDMYRSARSLFSAAIVPNRKLTVCDGCDLFERRSGK